MAVLECLQCGARQEASATGHDANDRVCPECGGPLRDLALPQE